MKIYFDMDGVLCDWDGKFKEYYPDLDPEILPNDKLWPLIKKIPDFWLNLKPIPGSLKLFKYCMDKYDSVEILSSPSRTDERSIPQKKEWLKKHLGQYNFKSNFVKRQNKRNFANENSILIDDNSTNVKQFRESGGMAILFTNPEQCLKELKNIDILMKSKKNT